MCILLCSLNRMYFDIFLEYLSDLQANKSFQKVL